MKHMCWRLPSAQPAAAPAQAPKQNGAKAAYVSDYKDWTWQCERAPQQQHKGCLSFIKDEADNSTNCPGCKPSRPPKKTAEGEEAKPYMDLYTVRL